MDERFGEFAKDFVLFCHITSQVEGDKHAQLLQEKGGRGFPYLVFMDAEGHVIGKHQGERTVDAFLKSGASVKAYAALKAKVASGGTPADQAELFMAEMELGVVKMEDVETRRAGLTLNAEQEVKYKGFLANIKVARALQGANPRDAEKMAEVSKVFYDMYKAGEIPMGGQPRVMFWNILMVQAEKEKDVEAFEKGLAVLKEVVGNNPQGLKMVEMMEGKLEAVKAALAAPPPPVPAPSAP